MTRTIVGILRGGTSSEYDLSLKTGAAMMAALPEERFDVRDIFIDKRGFWHVRGIPVTPARALSQIDVVLNALHGGVGEDGTVGRLVERVSVPYVGSSPLSSALALNKVRAREMLSRAGLTLPRGIGFTLGMPLTTGDMASHVFQRFGPPYLVKPRSEGASEGIRIADTAAELPNTIGDVLDAYGAALVEELILGAEATVGIIWNFRREHLYALPPTKVLVPEGSRYLSRAHHEEGSVRYLVPSDFRDEQKKALMQAARAAHQALGLGHFSRADLIVTPKRVYLLEVNPNPGLYQGAAFPQMLEAVGSSTSELLEHSIAFARGAV